MGDEEGNVYIASDQVYVYNREGKQIGVLEVPERPGSLAFGSPDNRTLFIGARSSLYSIRVVENAHRGYFYAPDSHTAVLAGKTWRPILQSSNLAAFSPGDEHYLTSEDDGRTYRAKLETDGKLTTSVFAERGGTSVINDAAGNVYLASDQVYVYNREGRQIGVLETPERPGSLAFGAPDSRTLFIGARSSVYSIRIADNTRHSSESQNGSGR